MYLLYLLLKFLITRFKATNQDKGYGFIGNEELKQRFNGMDVFLQVNQKRHFEQGDFVAFSVFKNKRGQPQATELRAR